MKKRSEIDDNKNNNGNNYIRINSYIKNNNNIRSNNYVSKKSDEGSNKNKK